MLDKTEETLLIDKSEEIKLIDRLRKGDNVALGEIYIHCKKYFINTLSQRYPKLEEIIEDIYHEVILIFKHNVQSGKFKGLYSTLSTYLISIGIRRISNLVRQIVKNNLVLNDPIVIGIENDTSQDDPLQIQALEDELSKNLKELGEPCRKIIEQFYFENKSLQEISQLMKAKDSKKISQKKWNCIEKLRKFFNQVPKNDEHGRI